VTGNTTPIPAERERYLALAAALVTVSLWASAFVGIRAASQQLPPEALALGPMALGFLTWGYALARTTAGRMGSMTYLAPPIAILLGWLLIGETPPMLALVGVALCLVGVAIARRR
jgi:drug/metabolite transporter (DMT)-like permease